MSKRIKERGAIVVEATLSLTAFVFAIFILLLLVNVYYIQSKIGVALNTAAKELSEYSYMYFKLGGDGIMDKLHEGTEDSMQTSKDTLDGTITLLNSLSSAGTSASDGDWQSAFDNINTAYNAGSSTLTMLADKIEKDPKGFVLGMGYLAVDQMAEEGKSVVCRAISKALMKKNLVADSNDTAEAFLKRYRVDNGLDGLDFNFTTFLPASKSDYIQVVVTYDVRVIKLLNLEYKFKIRQCSKTLAWARGVSKIHPETNVKRNGGSIWDNPAYMERGKYIVAQEKKNYQYTDTGHGFDAFDPSNNEFISIISLDPNMPSYQDPNAIANKLAAAYRDMYGKVDRLGDPITVTDSSGNTVTLPSDPSTRNFTIMLVVPENASDEVIRQAIAAAEAAYPGLHVEYKKAYGSPSTGEDNDGGGG